MSAVIKGLKMLKVVSYTLVAFFVWTNFLGPEGIAELNGNEIKDSNSNKEISVLILSSQLILWTIITAVLEVLDNTVEIFSKK